ncbi:hypothetical protein RhiirA4_423172 [Rhizophagus irregularis]|uniref:Ion transport domain-containing protein n=1 Tax=Rhizophagus irregularis TaxID=588596 RepID=A0A2I1GST7_9GLOM|nr:hypothetical protein RhiirA4_423172 [Rhizophagus irregularis]
MANTMVNPRDPHNAHDGKQVSLVSLSPNGKYIVTYSRDDKSIEGWIVKDSKLILDPEASVYKLQKNTIYEDNYEVISVYDSKIGYFVYNYHIEIFRMSNENQQIELNPPPESLKSTKKINFKKNGDLILSNNSKILIYHSKHDKMSNELSLVSYHKLLSSYNNVIKGVFIDDDNIWVISPNYLFHWDLKTFQLKFSYSLGFTTKYDVKKFTVITKGNSIAVNYISYRNKINEIAIFLKNVHFPIRNIQLKNSDMKIELCQVQNNVYLLAFNVPKKDEKQDIILYSITDINKQQPIDASKIFNDVDSENDSKNKFILYEYNSESKEAFGLVDGKFSYIDLLDLNWHEFFESHKEDDDLVEGPIDFSGPILPMIDTKDIADLEKDNHKQYFTQLSDSIVSIIEDERCLAKYGPTLLSNLVKSTDPKLTRHMEDIYNKCIKLVKEDPKRNMKFLNITSSMNGLYKKYPDYITKFNSEMFMVLDPSNERIYSDRDYSHFCTLSDEVEIRKIYQTIKSIKSIIIYIIKYILFIILIILIILCLILLLPFTIIYIIIFLIMNLKEFLESSSKFDMLLDNLEIEIDIGEQRKQQIVLITPYLDYSRYPSKYSSWKEIFYPPSSVFVNTCKKEFYSNWNGEAIINFKWKTFGRIYYFIIWLIFMIFLVCFTIASYPTNSITRKVRINLYQTTIAFGFFHLIFELRQFIWKPRKYFLSIWNLFGKSIYKIYF